MECPELNGYNRWGSLWNQYLAQQGYIVFSMDARGMSGRGENLRI